jgi:hypothetical protein
MLQLNSILDSLYGNNKMKKWLQTNSQHASRYIYEKVCQNLILNTVFTRMQETIFSLNLAIKYVRSS